MLYRKLIQIIGLDTGTVVRRRKVMYVCVGCKHLKVDCEGDKWYCGKEYYRKIERIRRGLDEAASGITKTIIKCDYKEFH